MADKNIQMQVRNSNNTATDNLYPKTKAENIEGLTKSHVGLGNVDDVQQASKAELESHKAEKATETELGHIKLSDVPSQPSDIGAEPSFTKNSAFNKNFGTGSSDVARGNHSHQYVSGATGEYTGDGTTRERVINLGFKPKLLIVSNGQDYAFVGGSATSIIAGNDISVQQVTLVSNGFKCSYYYHLNESGVKYTYLAI